MMEFDGMTTVVVSLIIILALWMAFMGQTIKEDAITSDCVTLGKFRIDDTAYTCTKEGE